MVRNDTDLAFQILVSVGQRYLGGEIRCDQPPRHSNKVFARREQFLRYGTEHSRRNEIWRSVTDKATGERLREELVKENCALVKYLPTGVPVLDCTPVG